MRVDPALEGAIPELTSIEYRGLKESIQTHGFLPAHEVIVTADDEVLLDGRSRLQVCAELGLEAPIARVNVPPEQRWDYVVVSNLRRRHLTIDQRRDILREYLRRHPETSNRKASITLDVDDKTVAAARREIGQATPFTSPPHRGVSEIPNLEQDRAPQTLQDAADHRNQVWFELTVNYPCESDQARTRGKLEYALPSERLQWVSGRQYLVTPAPSDDAAFAQLLLELARRCQRLAVDRPFRTMHRTRALV